MGPLLGRLGLGGALSDFGDLSGLADTLDNPGALAYARGQIISYGVSQGISANQTLSALRSIGAGFNRANFLETFRQVQAAYIPAQRAGSLALDESTGMLLPSTPPADWTGQYVHQVTVTWRTKDDFGNYEIHSHPYATKSNSVLTPAQAVEDVLGIISTPLEGDEDYRYPVPSDILVMALTGGFYDTNPGVLGRIGRSRR